MHYFAVSSFSSFSPSRCDAENPLDKIPPGRKHQHRSEKCHPGTAHSSDLPCAWDKKLKDSREDLKAALISEELKPTGKEKPRPRAGLIARGMMAGPVASPPEVIPNTLQNIWLVLGFYSQPAGIKITCM